MELDFNKKITFTRSNLYYYNIDIIDRNINDYVEFKKECILNEEFKKIFDSILFQTMLMDPNTNNVNDLLDLYNGLASGGIIDKIKFREISKKDFIKYLDLAGYRVHNTTRYVDGKTINVRRVLKKDLGV